MFKGESILLSLFGVYAQAAWGNYAERSQYVTILSRTRARAKNYARTHARFMYIITYFAK